MVSVEILTEQKQIVMQTAEGYFLKFSIDEIPEKKKSAVGVRGMKLGPKDRVENVYYIQSGSETVAQYGEKQIELSRLKAGKRDTKGTKVRV